MKLDDKAQYRLSMALGVLLVGIVYLVALFVFFVRRGDKQAHQEKLVAAITDHSGSITLCHMDNCWDTEVADTTSKRTTGLMNREELPVGSGMIFVFDYVGNYPFWMKNTLIPLDIMWLDEEFRIVDLGSMEPCKEEPCPLYKPTANSKYALEINFGQIEAYNITLGSRLQLAKQPDGADVE